MFVGRLVDAVDDAVDGVLPVEDAVAETTDLDADSTLGQSCCPILGLNVQIGV